MKRRAQLSPEKSVTLITEEGKHKYVIKWSIPKEEIQTGMLYNVNYKVCEVFH
jgi:hypothetical protein